MTDQAPGWQADPTGRHEHRYWDGSQWTDNVSDAGVAGTDAYQAADADPTSADPTSADPTVVDAPAADPTATWQSTPAPPPPPVYTPPAPGAVPSEPPSGGSKKGLIIGGAILVVVAIVAAVLLLGGDDGDSRDEVKAKMVSEMRSDGGLTEEQADCVADHFIDEIGVDRLEDVDFDADDPPAELADDFEDAFASMPDCGLSAGFDDDDSDDVTDDTTDDSVDDMVDDDGDGLPDDLDLDDLSGDMEEQMAQIYADTLGIPVPKAECLAGKITDAIESGDLSEEKAMSEMFGYFADCDIDMSEITGN